MKLKHSSSLVKLPNRKVRFVFLTSSVAGILIGTAYATEKAVEADSKTEFSLEIRERAESLENFNEKFYGAEPKLGSSSDTYLLSRLRLGLTKQFNDQFTGKISLQDSRAVDWGFADQDWKDSEFGGIENNPQDDPLELGETWLHYKNGGLTAQAGRQMIGYGNNRVFGASEWKNSGKWVWDAVKTGYKSGKNWVEALYGKTMIHAPDVFSLDHREGYVGSACYGHVQATDFLAIEPMLATKYNDGSSDYQEKDLLYWGARALLELNGFSADTTYVQQTGEITSNKGVDIDLDAQGFNLDLGYNFNPQWSVGTTFSFASGDNKNTVDNERFDGVFGASDKYYGLIHLMTWSNLLDYGLTANYRPIKDIDLRGEYHQLYADEISDKWLSYKSGLKANSDHYGNEIDFMATWNLNQTWKFMAGASVFLPDDAIKQAAASGQEFLTDDTAYSGFVQMTYKFNHIL